MKPAYRVRCIVPGVLLVAFVLSGPLPAAEYELTSPGRRLAVTVSVGDQILFSLHRASGILISPSPLSLSLRDRGRLGEKAEVVNVSRRTVRDILRPVVRVKSAEILDHGNDLRLDFAGGWALEVRAYDEGAAYRFLTDFEGRTVVESEEVRFDFPVDPRVWFPTEESFLTHSERLYEYGPLSGIPEGKMAHLPLLVEIPDGPRLAVTEAGLRDYPGLYLTGTSGTSLRGIFPAAAREENQTRDRTVEVTRRHDYLARTDGTRDFPWRIVVVADRDTELIESQLVYKLSPPRRIEDPSWIRPGKVAWDWWNALNLFGVDFAAGINTATYKYYIDFAARFGIEYIILDEGWSETTDLFKIHPDLDMEALLRHGREKNVGLILWVVWKTLDDQLEAALDRFAEWGVKGIKVDFMQRDDQDMVKYYWRVAREAAERRLLVDFHGSFKPAGLRRAYPNVLTREGVKGLENTKWSSMPDPEHDLILPFTRMLAGPMDYTPGAMINAGKKNFHASFERPMSLGTRCHQLALYVIFESPLQMLADSPSRYLREPECMEFLGPVPCVWDETRALEARVGDYALVARRSGEEWWVGALTDWNPRTLTLDFSFLDEGEWTAHIYADGPNAHRYAGDFEKRRRMIRPGDSIAVRLAPGGGWAARLVRR